MYTYYTLYLCFYSRRTIFRLDGIENLTPSTLTPRGAQRRRTEQESGSRRRAVVQSRGEEGSRVGEVRDRAAEREVEPKGAAEERDARARVGLGGVRACGG